MRAGLSQQRRFKFFSACVCFRAQLDDAGRNSRRRIPTHAGRHLFRVRKGLYPLDWIGIGVEDVLAGEADATIRWNTPDGYSDLRGLHVVLANYRKSAMRALLVFVALAIVAWFVFDAFSPTGSDYFKACWRKLQADVHAGLGKEGAPPSPEEAISWSLCEKITDRAIFEAGFVIAGSPRDENDVDAILLQSACPSALSDIPLGGPYMMTVALIEKDGGPKI